MVLLRAISRKTVTCLGQRVPGIVALLLVPLIAAPSPGESQNPHYERLQAALQHYERLANAGGWPTVPAGPTVEPGSRDPRVAVLAKRLAITGDLHDEGRQITAYDDELQAAVLHFQRRHGLEPDALVGKNTLRALNVPADQRVRQIRINLERLLHVHATPRDDFLLVNIPAFEVTLFRGGEARWTSKIIVGETEARTPIFEATLKYVVINPTWTVPRSISSEELLPKIQRDRGFLSQGGYDLLDADGNPVDPSDVDWPALHANNFPYTLVQRPGTLNELGRIKFMFPNEYGVCMHDTPSKHLFAENVRAFSHGCIRVDQPIDFAEKLLEPEGLTRDLITAQLESGETHTVLLAEPLPVVSAYLTAEASEDGTVHFYRDIYRRD
jgi:murein L,D-transpeptidase YcbB/YkuD